MFAKKREESLLDERCTISTTDFVTYMLVLRSKGAHSLTLEDIVDNVMGIIIGAHGTTSALITFMMRHHYYIMDLLSRAVTAFSPSYHAGTTIPGLKVKPSVPGHRAGTKEGLKALQPSKRGRTL
jgi:hypothetical protein